MEHLETTRMLTMCKPASNSYSAPECADSLARAEALEREITDLCAQINAANYRLLQLIVALENEKPWAAWGSRPAHTGSTGAAASDSTRRAKKSGSRTHSYNCPASARRSLAASSASPRCAP
jgi:hypothetical protein